MTLDGANKWLGFGASIVTIAGGLGPVADWVRGAVFGGRMPDIGSSFFIGLALLSIIYTTRLQAKRLESLEAMLDAAFEFGFPAASDNSTRADVVRSAALLKWRDEVKKRKKG